MGVKHELDMPSCHQHISKVHITRPLLSPGSQPGQTTKACCLSAGAAGWPDGPGYCISVEYRALGRLPVLQTSFLPVALCRHPRWQCLSQPGKCPVTWPFPASPETLSRGISHKASTVDTAAFYPQPVRRFLPLKD